MDDRWDTVHTMTDFWDGPVRGIADFGGTPHLYERQFDQADDDDRADVYLLTPVDAETFALAMEDWVIWRRLETAFHAGRLTFEQFRQTHPALPEDRPRHEHVGPLLEARLRTDPGRAVRVRGEFRRRDDPEWSGLGRPSLEVRWTPPRD